VAIKAVDERRAERERLLERARAYVESLASRLDVRAAAVVGSVARGDFNVWSDVDVRVVVAEELPARAPDRAWRLLEAAPPRVQPIGYTLAELEREWIRGNRLVREAVSDGVCLRGATVFERLRQPSPT
jgi:predicted nucleotidyltransferase